jgi:hypothetical protein
LGVSGATDHLLELGDRVILETTALEPGRLVEAKTLGNENIDVPTTGGGERQKGGVNEDKS